MSSLLAAGAGLYAAANAFGIGIGTTAVGATMAATGLGASAAQMAVAGASGAALGALGMSKYKDQQFERERANYRELLDNYGTALCTQKACTEEERIRARQLWNGIEKAKKTGNQGVIDYALGEWEEFAREHPIIAAKTGKLL